MEEQNTGAETTSNYFNMDNLQTERAIICPISHYKETSRTTTTNRIKRAQTANKALLLQLYTLQQEPLPHRRTDTRKQMKRCYFIDRGGGVKNLRYARKSHAPPFLHTRRFF